MCSLPRRPESSRWPATSATSCYLSLRPSKFPDTMTWFSCMRSAASMARARMPAPFFGGLPPQRRCYAARRLCGVQPCRDRHTLRTPGSTILPRRRHCQSKDYQVREQRYVTVLDSLRGRYRQHAGHRLRLRHQPLRRPAARRADRPGGTAGRDRFRFANELRAWIEVNDAGQITDAGYAGSGLIGSTTLQLGALKYRFEAVKLPDLRREPERGDGWIRFSQTVGGRTGLPMPRRVSRKPFVQWQAPLVWTTLTLGMHADGHADFAMTGASPFPRHWIYDGAASSPANPASPTSVTGWRGCPVHSTARGATRTPQRW